MLQFFGKRKQSSPTIIERGVKKLKVICVDDNSIIRDQMIEYIKEIASDANVIGFESADEAISFVQDAGCDILFTEIETADMEKIGGSFLESLVCGRIYKCLIGKHTTNIIKVKNFNKETKFFRVSNSQLAKAEKRALRNQEDLTKKSLWIDMMD